MNIKIFAEYFPWKYDLNIPEFSTYYFASDYCTPSGKYHIYLKKDVNSPVKVGFFSAQKLFMNIADLHGLQPFLIMDELSQEWCTIYSVISSEIWEQNEIPNILLLDRLLIYPEFRGKNYGLLAIKAIVEHVSKREILLSFFPILSKMMAVSTLQKNMIIFFQNKNWLSKDFIRRLDFLIGNIRGSGRYMKM